MKRCPKCGITLTDDNDFCLNDGARLIADIGTGDIPTQVIRQTPIDAKRVSSGSSPLLYLLIGVLGTGFTATMIFVYVSRGNESTPNRTTGEYIAEGQRATPSTDASPTISIGNNAVISSTDTTPVPVVNIFGFACRKLVGKLGFENS